MKVIKFVTVLILMTCLVGPVWAKGGKGNGGGSTSTLTEQEAKHLVFLRQEEKLARDVYVAFAGMYGTPIFVNISASEQNHMDSVKGLIDKYGLVDPAVDNNSCAFANVDYNFTELCEQLIAKGQDSLEAALGVGEEIEVMDIHDIEKVMLPDVTQADVKRVLQNLLSGSYNHLDAFERSLE